MGIFSKDKPGQSVARYQNGMLAVPDYVIPAHNIAQNGINDMREILYNVPLLKDGEKSSITVKTEYYTRERGTESHTWSFEFEENSTKITSHRQRLPPDKKWTL